MIHIAITACGCVDDEGFGSARVWTAWPQDAATPPRLRWSTLSQRPFDRFGRLDLLCKAAVAAAEMLELPVPEPGESRPDTALVLGTDLGCIDVDLRFCRSMAEEGGASPKLFSYTLPSTALGELAIRHQVTGPNLCLSAGPGSGLLALWEGAKLLLAGEARCCIAIGAEAAAPPAVPEPILRACAFLLDRGPTDREPLATLSFARDDEALCRATRPDRPLRCLFRFATRRDGIHTSPALYLKAPRTLVCREALVVAR